MADAWCVQSCWCITHLFPCSGLWPEPKSWPLRCVQGIELQNPSARPGQEFDIRDTSDGTQSYFSEYSGFRSIKQMPV